MSGEFKCANIFIAAALFAQGDFGLLADCVTIAAPTALEPCRRRCLPGCKAPSTPWEQPVNYHVSYSAEEDRLLVAVEVKPDEDYAMALPRRLTKLVIGTLADLQVKKKVAALDAERTAASPRIGKTLEAVRRDPVMRDTVLNFEHAHAVAAGVASGDTRPRQRTKPLVASPKLVREVKITPKPDGGAVIRLNDKERVLTLDLNAQRVHSFMAGILEVATKAGWDLPVIAAWLDRAPGKGTDMSTVVH